MKDLSVDFVFEHGDRFPMDGDMLTVVHTPGHSIGHCCFLLESKGVLFTGDHILGAGTSIIVPPEGDMAAYMDSLDRLLSYPAAVICPGHGPVVWEARQKILEYAAHRRQREEAIVTAVQEGIVTIEALVTRIYTDVPVFLHGLAGFSVEAHLIKLEQEGRIRKRKDHAGYETV